MLFFNRHTNWNNRDYRAYCDHRTLQKRRLRLRISIGLTLTLIGCLLLVVAWL